MQKPGGIVIHLKLQSYENYLKFATRKVSFVADLWPGIRNRYKDCVHLPTHIQKWTVLSSPFKHSKSRTQYERRTFARIVSVEAPDRETANQFIRFVYESLPEEVGTSVVYTSLYKLEDFYNPPVSQYLEEDKHNHTGLIGARPLLALPVRDAEKARATSKDILTELRGSAPIVFGDEKKLASDVSTR